MQTTIWNTRKRTKLYTVLAKPRHFFALLILLLLIVAPFLLDAEKKTLDDQARKGTAGSYVPLSDGVTHYELAGPQDGLTTVLIHGGSVPYFIWDRTSPALVDSGIRVLRYDLYGRGYSDRPKVVYNRELYRRQLIQLLAALRMNKPVHLVGVSMGAMIAADFADRFPEKTGKICLINPVGFPVKLPFTEKLTHVPLLGEYVFTVIGPQSMIEFVKRDHAHPPPPEYISAYADQMQYKGFRRGMISTLRNMPLKDMQGVYGRIGKRNSQILLIWGKQDTVAVFENNVIARKLMPSARFVPVNGGHAVHFERSEIVNPVLIEFLRAGVPS